MSKKVLITGGAGFVGSHLTDELIRKGYHVRVFDNLEPQVHGKDQKVPDYLNKRAEFIKGDIRNENEMRKALKDIDIILHEASVVGVGQSMYQIYKYMEVNTLGTANLLEILAGGKHNVSKLIVASSMSIYGEGEYECSSCNKVYPTLRSLHQLEKKDWEMKCPECGNNVAPVPTTEEKPLYPTSIYAISKRDQEEMCLNVGRAYGIPTVALRYFNIYGPRQALSNPYTGVAAIFSSRILHRKSPIIFEDGKQSRDFIHVSDVVRATILSMEKKEANYEVFNIGTGKRLSVLDMAYQLIEAHKTEITPKIINRFRKGDIRHCYADVNKIKNKLGFEAKIEFEDGTSDLVNWAKEQESLDKFDNSKEELAERNLII